MNKAETLNRRAFLRNTIGLAGAVTFPSAAARSAEPARRLSLFNGRDLTGWRAIPRLYVPTAAPFGTIPADQLKDAVIKWHQDRPEMQAKLKHTGRWEVVDGAIVGGQEPQGSGLGAYLISEKKFADFELELEARPDWPVDTGIMLRAHELGVVGFQVLVDHRPNGGIGGVFGNSIGNFLATPFTVNGEKQPCFGVTNLHEGEREKNFEAPAMNFAASFADFAKAWHAHDWNHFRIRCVGRLPVITTWINGTKICQLDTAKIQTKGYAESVAKRLGPAGHIAFEVHDVNPKNPLGQDRWAVGAVCRWKNIVVSEL